MFEAEVDVSENSNTSTCHDWPTVNSCPPLSAQQASPALPQPCPASQPLALPQLSSALPRPETESSCMEIEAAQRKLQEIEDRYVMCSVQKVRKTANRLTASLSELNFKFTSYDQKSNLQFASLLANLLFRWKYKKNN